MRNHLLRIERLRHGWTQQQLADFAGISLSTVERSERGEPIRVDCIQRLCECLSKTSEELGLLNLGAKLLESDNHMKRQLTPPNFENFFPRIGWVIICVKRK